MLGLKSRPIIKQCHIIINIITMQNCSVYKSNQVLGMIRRNITYCRPRVNGPARVDERGVCFVVVPIKYIVGVRHALIAPQSYDVRVHVYTYSKVVTRRDL